MSLMASMSIARFSRLGQAAKQKRRVTHPWFCSIFHFFETDFVFIIQTL